MRNKLTVILGAALLLVLIFIWGNSILSPEVSGKISGFVGDVMADVLGEGDSSTTVGGLPVRKLGHFFEYLGLGVVVLLFLASFLKNPALRFSILVSAGLAVPLIDETIQIFSGRGPSLTDVWIDVAGYSLGCVLAYFAVIIAKNTVLKSKK